MIPRESEAGFTLIELLISLLLFGLIAVAGLALVDSVLGIEERTGSRLDRLAEVQRAVYVLTLDLEQVANGPVESSGNVLSFNRRAAALGGIPVPVRYALKGDVLGRTVGGPAGDARQRVLTGVSALRWRFYTPQGGWIDRWPPDPAQAKAWPVAVAAEIRLAGDTPGPTGLLRRVVALPARP